jgi:addiction module RelE/StbE family toxin
MRVSKHKNFVKSFRLRITPHQNLVRRFNERMELFLSNSTDPVLHDHALGGNLKGKRSFSITGDIRVIYRILPDQIILIDIGSHNQVY